MAIPATHREECALRAGDVEADRIVYRAQRCRFKAGFELIDGRRFHQDREWQLVLQLLLDAVEQIDSRKGVAAAQEEVIVAADVLALEHIAPQGQQRLLNLRAWLDPDSRRRLLRESLGDDRWTCLP